MLCQEVTIVGIVWCCITMVFTMAIIVADRIKRGIENCKECKNVEDPDSDNLKKKVKKLRAIIKAMRCFIVWCWLFVCILLPYRYARWFIVLETLSVLWKACQRKAKHKHMMTLVLWIQATIINYFVFTVPIYCQTT